jgi:nucleoside-diphosphate-sugar epimerase
VTDEQAVEQKMRVLVTGATGLTGWHAAARLRASGHAVRALARDSAKAERLLTPLGIGASDIVIGDMTDPAAVARALDGCSAALHTAAAVTVTDVVGDDVFEANVTGTKLVVGGACERGLDAVVFVSSLTAIFDPRSSAPTTADSPLVKSGTRYGRSKAESDAFVRSLQADGAPVAIVYPSAILGPDDPGRSESMSAFRGFVKSMLDSEGGTQFVDARDLARLLERLLEGCVAGRFVAAGEFFSWPELTRRIESVTGARVGRLRVPGWLLRSGGSLADIVSRMTGRPLPLTRESLEIATRWRRIDDAPELAELGIAWRAPESTLADVYRWFIESGGLPAKLAPRLAAPGERPGTS